MFNGISFIALLIKAWSWFTKTPTREVEFEIVFEIAVASLIVIYLGLLL